MARPRESTALQAERAFVGRCLPGQICDRCGATLATYSDQCSAELDDACPGFKAIEEKKAEFWMTYI